MTNKDITKIYFRGNEIVALYRGDTLIFKKSGVVPPPSKPTGVYTVRGTLKPDSRARNIQLCVNGKREQFDVNNDKTFEYTFTNVPVTNMDYFTQQCKDELKTLDLSDLDTSQVTSMIQAFYQCSNLTSIDLTNVDISNVTDMTRMFTGCRYLTDIDLTNVDTSNVTDMTGMFSGCYGLKSLDVSRFDTSKVTNMNFMFASCSNLTSLDISNLDTSKVERMSNMFNYCTALEKINLGSIDVSNVISNDWMFANCKNLKLLDISKVNFSRTGYMFVNDINLTDLYLNIVAPKFLFLGTEDFPYCNKLTNVIGKYEGTENDLDLHYSPLTAASAMVFINGLATITTKRTLKLSATTYDSLTPEQIAIATSKGWTVTRS